MAGGDDRRWPGAEAIVSAAVGIGREAARASLGSAPAGTRGTPGGQRTEKPPVRERPEGGTRRRRAPAGERPAPTHRAEPGPRHAAPGAAVAVSRVEGAGRHAAPEPAPPAPPARPASPASPARPAPPALARRRRPLRSAARRIGGPDWGLRLAFSLVAALMLLTVTGFAFERLTGVDVLPDGPPARFWPAPRDFPVLARSLPVSIRARSVRIDAQIHSVGNTPSGAIDVPTGGRFDEAGWYEKGPSPGEYGPAVIVGHVDSGTGPSVFHQLSRLRPGNRVEVTRADGSVAVFEVNSVKRFDRDNLPADQVFGDFSRPALRLITCGGRWVGGTTGYADNVVVFASLVKAR